MIDNCVTEYRNQHYVPELLLKGWATEGNVVTFHFDSGHEQPNQPISEICSRNYLYTTPRDTTLEEKLGDLEGRQADPIRALRAGVPPSELSTTDCWALCSYIFTQRLRTRVYREELLEGGGQVYDIPLQRDFWDLIAPRNELQINEETFRSLRDAKIKASVKQVQNYLMMHGFLGLVLRDLDVVLAENDTDEEFICSDSPVVFDNIRFKHEIDQYYPGVANRGFLAYCPISPNKYVILYDPIVYMFEHDNGHCFTITDTDVIKLLNQFQVMNSGDIAIYTTPSKSDELQHMKERSLEFMRYETIPKRLETSFEVIEYEIPPRQPLPDTGNPFQKMHINTNVSYSKKRTPRLSATSEKIVNSLLEKAESTPEAAIHAIEIALEYLNS